MTETKACIHLQIAPLNSVKFIHPASNLKAKLPVLHLYGLDNHSSPDIVNGAIQMLKQADKVLVILSLTDGENPGTCLRFLNELIRKSDGQLQIWKEGHHPFVTKMMNARRNECNLLNLRNGFEEEAYAFFTGSR